MGRYVTGDFEYKFWFGCQPSSDIEEFGGNRGNTWEWVEEELEPIKEKVKELKKEFSETHKITFKAFMKKIESKGYLSSSADEETNTEEWKKMSRDASRIELGEEIVKALESTDSGYVYVSFEE